MALTITSLSPTDLPINGGTTIRIKGTDLNTVTTVTYNGVSIAGFTKVSPTLLEFPSPEWDSAGLKSSIAVSLSAGGAPASHSYDFTVWEYGKTFPYHNFVRAWQSGTVRTSATGEKAPWLQQVDYMEIREVDGDPVPDPVPVFAPQFDSDLQPIVE